MSKLSEEDVPNIVRNGFSYGDLFPKDMAQWPSQIVKIDAKLMELADEIERSNGLYRNVAGEGMVELGITKTTQVIAAIRKAAGKAKS
jgi:hypothetical protein